MTEAYSWLHTARWSVEVTQGTDSPVVSTFWACFDSTRLAWSDERGEYMQDHRGLWCRELATGRCILVKNKAIISRNVLLDQVVASRVVPSRLRKRLRGEHSARRSDAESAADSERDWDEIAWSDEADGMRVVTRVSYAPRDGLVRRFEVIQNEAASGELSFQAVRERYAYNAPLEDRLFSWPQSGVGVEVAELPDE